MPRPPDSAPRAAHRLLPRFARPLRHPPTSTAAHVGARGGPRRVGQRGTTYEKHTKHAPASPPWGGIEEAVSVFLLALGAVFVGGTRRALLAAFRRKFGKARAFRFLCLDTIFPHFGLALSKKWPCVPRASRHIRREGALLMQVPITHAAGGAARLQRPSQRRPVSLTCAAAVGPRRPGPPRDRSYGGGRRAG